jgi:hypothetical protein
MSTTITYITNGNLVLTESKAVTISCVGAGGRGNFTGNGGSGGAFAKATKTLQSGSYPVVVGLASAHDGGNSYVTSASVVIVRAPGGKQDGTITHQTALLTGSVATYYGGHGSPDFDGYSAYNGSGGGEAGNVLGNGQDGQSAYYSTAFAPASGGYSYATGSGGAGAYYYAGSKVNQVFVAAGGTFPGGGGGGSYDYGTDSSGAGANGSVVVTY